jgi:ribosomal protein S18 acetylase RimI-like enzyme
MAGRAHGWPNVDKPLRSRDVTTAQIHVSRATRTDAGVLGRTLAGAFLDDPVIGWLIPFDVDRRQQRLETFFTSMSRSYLRRDKHAYLAGDGVGAALWSAPGSWKLPPSEVLRESRPSVRAFGRNLGRALRTQLELESGHPKDPKHWYLGYVGVAPGHQGQGVGSLVLREVLEQATTNGIPAYLESSNERNLTLYERNGFRVTTSYRALGSGPTIWRMWREPA